MFMLRRLLYAAILIGWVDRNYFQIQSVIFKCSLVMIYTGYMKPFKMQLNNNLDLITECLVILSSYSLLMFSAMVYKAETRYTCGWYLIVLVFLLIAVNLSVIIYQAVRLIITMCKRRILKAKIRNAIKQKKLAQKAPE